MIATAYSGTKYKNTQISIKKQKTVDKYIKEHEILNESNVGDRLIIDTHF